MFIGAQAKKGEDENDLNMKAMFLNAGMKKIEEK